MCVARTSVAVCCLCTCAACMLSPCTSDAVTTETLETMSSLSRHQAMVLYYHGAYPIGLCAPPFLYATAPAIA